VGETVTMSPLAPRSVVANAINDTITSLYPDLYGVGSTEFTCTSEAVASWSLPAEAEMVLSVRFKDSDGNWQKVRRWELENEMSSGDFATGKAIRICGVPVGQLVQVVYGVIPTRLDTGPTAFAESGLAASYRDLVVLGAQLRVLPSLDVARLSVRTVSADELDQPIQVGSATQLAKEMQARFTARVKQELSVLQRRYPAPVHFTR
jgi:hypothetical protein